MTEPNAFMTEVMDLIVEKLTDKVMTTQELATSTGHAYPTVRKAVVMLVDSGRIIPFDNRARGARYALAPNDARPTKIIPSISFKGSTIPLTQIYRGQGIETTLENAANQILKSWTTIAMTAKRLHEGIPAPALVKRTNRERVSLVQTRNNLEQIVFICNQLLDNDKLWDPTYLANFHEDADWQSFLPNLEELYAHYYPEASNG